MAHARRPGPRSARESAPRRLCSEGQAGDACAQTTRGRVEDYRLARTHAQPGGSGAGACPGAEERGGTTEHAQVGPAGAGQEPAGC